MHSKPPTMFTRMLTNSFKSVILFKLISMVCGTDNIMLNIPTLSPNDGIFYKILSIQENIVMNLHIVKSFHVVVMIIIIIIIKNHGSILVFTWWGSRVCTIGARSLQ